jgi:hypothetical protein
MPDIPNHKEKMDTAYINREKQEDKIPVAVFYKTV